MSINTKYELAWNCETVSNGTVSIMCQLQEFITLTDIVCGLVQLQIMYPIGKIRHRNEPNLFKLHI